MNAPAPPAPKTAPKKGRRRKVLIPLMIVLSAVSMFAAPTALVVAVGILPGVIAILTDREPGRLTGMTVASINLITLTPILGKLWSTGNSMQLAVQLSTSVFTWALMLLGALLGFMMIQMLPAAIGSVITARDKMRLERIRARQKQLVDEWGQEVTEGK